MLFFSNIVNLWTTYLRRKIAELKEEDMPMV